MPSQHIQLKGLHTWYNVSIIPVTVAANCDSHDPLTFTALAK